MFLHVFQESLNLMRKRSKDCARSNGKTEDSQSINGNESTDSSLLSDDITLRLSSKRFRNGLTNTSSRKRKSAVSENK